MKTARRTPVEVKKRSEIYGRKNEHKQKKRNIEINNYCDENLEDLQEFSVNENEQKTIDCDFDLEMLDNYLHKLEAELQPHEGKVKESTLSQIPAAIDHQMGESQIQQQDEEES